MRKLIATGGKAGAGKDYILERLLRYEAGQRGDWVISGFGDLVRAELGITDPKERRDLQQAHGQMRRGQDPGYWTKKAVEWGYEMAKLHNAVGFTGVRFENELDILHEAGFYIVLVEAPLTIRERRLYERDGRRWSHAELTDVTETSLDQIPREAWDVVWDNG